MDKSYNKKIQGITDKLGDLMDEIDKIQDKVQGSGYKFLRDLQGDEKSERMADMIYNLDHAYCSIGDAISYLDDEINDHKNKKR